MDSMAGRVARAEPTREAPARAVENFMMMKNDAETGWRWRIYRQEAPKNDQE